MVNIHNFGYGSAVLDKILKEQADEKRHVSIELTPEIMDQLIRDPFGETSPLQLNTMEESEYRRIPLLNSVRYLAEVIERQGRLKLTQNGCLQRKVVMDLYQQSFVPQRSKHKITDYKKNLNEYDVLTAGLTRILLDLSGLARKSKGTLLPTRKWEKLKGDNDKLLRLIFETFTQKLNWAYVDRSRSEHIAQHGFAVSLALVYKFGEWPLSTEIYSGAYFSMFPRLVEEFSDTPYFSARDKAVHCYSFRTFDRFLEYFGLVKVHRDDEDYLKADEIEKSDLFDKFITVDL
jgi:hypothetical protein